MDLTTEQITKLTRLKNRATLYEVALVNVVDGRRMLLAYSGAARQRIMSYIGKNGPAVVAFCGAEEFRAVRVAERTEHPRVVAAMGNWLIVPTGRTQREAVMHGELPWFGTQKVGA